MHLCKSAINKYLSTGGALIASSLLRSLGDYARVEEENDLAQELYQAAG